MILKNKKAFTLTELLLALAVVGTVAALSIPALLDTINRKVLSSQLKNTVLMVQNLADEQLVNNKPKLLTIPSFRIRQNFCPVVIWQSRILVQKQMTAGRQIIKNCQI